MPATTTTMKPTTTTVKSTTTTVANGKVCVQTTAQGKCFYSAVPYITGANQDPYLNQNIWNGDSTYKQTLYGTAPNNWYIVANANTNFGGVLSYPNVGFTMPENTIDSYSSITSSWNVTMPTDTTKVAGWAAYDLWFNNWADEVMIQTDITAPSAYDCDSAASTTINGMPWHLCDFGSERVLKPGTDDQHLQNMTSGSVDVKALLTWLESTGHLPASSKWTASSFGYEICDTHGTDQTFKVNDFTWTAK